MRRDNDTYTRFGLVRDMLDVPGIIARFDASRAADTARDIAGVGRLLLTGEGSSRLFPAKNVIAHARRHGWGLQLHTEAGQQAQEYDLSEWAVFALSNSGRTREVIELFTRLKDRGHAHLYSLTAFANSKLESLAARGYVLGCGEEGAVAATKSVLEQALFLRAMLETAVGEANLVAGRVELSGQFEQALTSEIAPEIVDAIAGASAVYWAGRNDGVAEELTLKSNEIIRKPADYLEGTYAMHGIEEVLQPDQVLIWVDPYEGSEEKFEQVLVHGVGMKVIAIASRPTRFPTVQIPDAGDQHAFVQIAAGWNLLVEVGLRLGVNLDKPQRARKVGNEFAAQ